jgi:hypothetical protein
LSTGIGDSAGLVFGGVTAAPPLAGSWTAGLPVLDPQPARTSQTTQLNHLDIASDVSAGRAPDPWVQGRASFDHAVVYEPSRGVLYGPTCWRRLPKDSAPRDSG